VGGQPSGEGRDRPGFARGDEQRVEAMTAAAARIVPKEPSAVT
jgi:hypothetical protein